MMEDPREHSLRKFDAGVEPPLWTALDVVVRYASDPPLAVETLLDAVRPAAGAGARLCELGYGPGWFLDEMLSAFPETRLCGLDMSRNATTGARKRFAGQVELILGDIERLPFTDGSFDAIAANWVLYFMRDIDAALAEIYRCVRLGGLVVAATVAPDHMLEFDEMVAESVRRALGREPDRDIAHRFNTVTGMAHMQRAFKDVELREYSGEMVLPDVETMLVLWPGYGPQLIEENEDAAARAEFERLARDVFSRDGQIRLRRHDGVFVAHA